MKKNERMPLASIWMDLEIIILSEVTQTEKDKYHFRIHHLRWNRCQDADFREDSDREDHHSRGRALGYNRKCKGQDPE